MPQLSVIIPAYNEEMRLPATLSSVHEFLSQRKEPFEIIIVDDGSRDGTASIVRKFQAQHQGVNLISYKPNQGKGHAVRTGMLAAGGDLLLLNDADGASPISELPRLEEAIAKGASVAIGSRAKPGADTRVNALAHRKHIGNTFNFIVQSLVVPGIYDTQCGFKLFKREAGRELFAVSRLTGYAFDVELLYLARLKGLEIAEIPINWTNITGSKVNLLSDPLKMLIDILKIVVRRHSGEYARLIAAYRSCNMDRDFVGD